MAEDFSFETGASLEQCQKFLEYWSGAPLEKWPVQATKFLEAKGPLLKALSPSTGRVTVTVVSGPPDPDECLRALSAACSSLGHANFSDFVSPDEAALDQIAEDSGLIRQCPKIKRGMKIGRAFCHYLRHHYGAGVLLILGGTRYAQNLLAKWHSNLFRKGAPDRDPDDEEFVVLMANALAEARVAPAGGTVCVSANPLDILMMSDSTSGWTTCHRPAGEHQAGPQQYLYDGHTAVCYYYRECRQHTGLGVKLPHKLWRQLAHVDLGARQASFMREYPRDTSLKNQGALLKILADAFATHHGKAPDSLGFAVADYALEKHTEVPVAGIKEGGGLHEKAYVDKLELLGPRVVPAGNLQTGNLQSPPVKYQLAGQTPCASCGGSLSHSRRLLCMSCSVGGACADCGWSFRRANTDRFLGPTKNYYCKSCLDRRWATCDECGHLEDRDAAYRVPGGTRVCRGCFKRTYAACPHCGSNFAKKDLVAVPEGLSVCGLCLDVSYRPCLRCTKVTLRTPRTVSMTAYTPQGGHYCLPCRKDMSATYVTEVAKAEAPPPRPDATPPSIHWIVTDGAKEILYPSWTEE